MRDAVRLIAGLIGGILLTGIASAQTLPEPLGVRPQIDARGVNVINDKVQLNGLSGVAIGPAGGGLSFERFYADGGWRSSALGTLSNSGTSYSVSLGGAADTFTGPSTIAPLCGVRHVDLGSSTQGTGGTLEFDYSYDCEFQTFEYQLWTYTDRTGAVFVFDKALTGGKLGSVAINQGVLISASFPTGDSVSYNYNIVTLGGSPPAAAARLQSIAGNGYMIHFDYASNIATQQSHFPNWRNMTKATAFDMALETCGALSSTCTFTNSWPSVTFTGSEFKVDSATDAAGRATIFTHNSYGKLTGVRFSGSSADNAAYAYAAGGAGDLTSVTVNGGQWTYAKSDAGDSRTITVTNPMSQVERTVVSTISTGLIATDMDGANNTTSYLYDPSGRVERVTAPEGNYVQYGYDGRGNLTSTTAVAKAGSGLSNIVTSAVYPATCANLVTCNKPTSTTDALGKVTDYAYDSTHGGVLTVIAPAPAAGGVRQQVTYGYASISGRWRPTTITTCATAQTCAGTANESKTTIAYTGAHLLPTTISSGGGDGVLTATSTLTYTIAGDVATVDGPLSGTSDTSYFFYDASRAPLGGIGPDPDGAGALKRRATKTTFIANTGLVDYADQGTVTGTTLSALNAIVSLLRADTDYDSYGRAVKASNIVGGLTQGVAQVSYDAAGRTDCTALRMNATFFASLPASACTLGTPAGSFGEDRIAKTAYDPLGRVTSVTTAFGVPAVQTIEATTYTANGLVATVIDGKNNTTTYEYDGFDRLKKTRMPHPTTAETSSTTDYEQLTYDAGSRVTQRRLRDGQLINYGYDFRHRLITVDVPGTDDDVTNVYDVMGRLTSSALPGQTNSFAWDMLGRLVSETSPQNGVNKTVSYQYDLAGRRTRVTYPDTTSLYVQYDYDLAGAMIAIREKGAASGLGVTATYSYNDLGQRVSTARADGAGAATSYAYNDPAKRLSQIVHDLDGAGTANDLTLDFSYSPASQIASRTASNDAYSWLGHFNEDVTDLINGLNQPTMIGATNISHDDRGNLTTDGSTIFTYDAQNRLVSTADGASFKYDALGRLYEVTKAGATTRFLYDGSEVIAEYDGSGALLRRYVRGAAPDEVVLWYEGAALTARKWLLQDERGSIVAAANSSGTTLFKNVYDEYGKPGQNNQGRFQYTGQMWLAEAGLYHYKARLYDPGIGRFLQTDPIGYADGLNMYAYVADDPVNNVDPTGLEIPCYTCWRQFADGGSGGGGGSGGSGGGGGGCLHCGGLPDPKVFGNAVVNDLGGGNVAGGNSDGGGGIFGSGGSSPHSQPTNVIQNAQADISAICNGPGGCFTVVGYREVRRGAALTAFAYLAYKGFQSSVNETFDPDKLTPEQRENLCLNAQAAQLAGTVAQGVGLGFAFTGAYLDYVGGKSVPGKLSGKGLEILGLEFAIGGFLLEKGGNFVEKVYCK